MALTEDSVRRIVREELEARGTVGRLAFTMRDAAEQAGYSYKILRRAISRGELQASSATSRKGVILATELLRWLRSLPNEPLER